MKKILFITHETSRTGAPFVLLYFLRWLKEHLPEVHLTVLALKGGELNEDFKISSDAFLENSGWSNRLKKYFFKISNIIVRRNQSATLFVGKSKLLKKDFDIIYANSVVSIPAAVSIRTKCPNSKLIVHVHEMSTMIKILLPDFSSYFKYLDYYIAVSSLVKRKLIEDFSVPEEEIETVHAFTNPKQIMARDARKKSFTVGASGLFFWRKGGDNFVQLARYMKKKYPHLDIQFIWVGAIPKLERTILAADLEKLDIHDVIKFTGKKRNPAETFNEFDIFILPSREDPFPLVAIELGMLGKPIICFKGASGTEEILNDGGGLIVPYLDIEAMAEGIFRYYSNRDMLLRDGEKAKDLFKRFKPENMCPQLYSVLEKIVVVR